MQTQNQEKKNGKAPVIQNTEKGLALPQSSSEWDLDKTDSRDMVIPKILIGQGLSPAVAEGKVKMGEIYDSVSGKILGSAEEKNSKLVEFIPFKEEVIWVLEQLFQGRFRYRGSEPRTPNTENLELEFEKDGQKWRRNRALRYHVLLTEDLEQPIPFPRVITCMRTSFPAGKALHNHFVLTKAAMEKGHKVNPADTAFSFGGRKTTNDKGTFYVYDVKALEGKTKVEHQKIAFEWLKTLKTASYVIDGADEDQGEAPAQDAKVTGASQF